MKNILIATDLTLNCDRALERAVRLAGAQNARLHVAHIAPVYVVPGGGRKTRALKEDTEFVIRSYLAGYKGTAGLDAAIHVIEGGEPFVEIIGLAEKVKAGLIVMGLHNKVGFRDLFAGTTVERVIRKGVKPVLMVRDKPQGDYKKILVGSDFSESALAAFTAALSLAGGASVRLVHSYDILPDSKIERIAGGVIRDVETGKTDELVKASEKLLRKYGIAPGKFSHRTVKGAPYDALMAEAEKMKADLLAVGVHDRPGLWHSKLGGVTEKILADPPCDVLVAKGV